MKFLSLAAALVVASVAIASSAHAEVRYERHSGGEQHGHTGLPWEASPNNFTAIRTWLQRYDGPTWNPQEDGDQLGNQYMNKPVPAGAQAVPCRPPGYDHTILCVRRDH